MPTIFDINLQSAIARAEILLSNLVRDMKVGVQLDMALELEQDIIAAKLALNDRWDYPRMQTTTDYLLDWLCSYKVTYPNI